jgi:hypothetical protein
VYLKDIWPSNEEVSEVEKIKIRIFKLRDQCNIVNLLLILSNDN